jgi:hypothetical protein
MCSLFAPKAEPLESRSKQRCSWLPPLPNNVIKLTARTIVVIPPGQPSRDPSLVPARLGGPAPPAAPCLERSEGPARTANPQLPARHPFVSYTARQ